MAFMYEDLHQVRNLINFPPAELRGMGQEKWKKFRLDMGEKKQNPNDDFNDGIYIWKDEDNNVTFVYIDGVPVQPSVSSPGLQSIKINGNSISKNAAGVGSFLIEGNDGLDIYTDPQGNTLLQIKVGQNVVLDTLGVNAKDTTYEVGDGLEMVQTSVDPLNPKYKISSQLTEIEAGENITANKSGTKVTISTLGTASKTKLGFIKPGDGLGVMTDGTVYVEKNAVVDCDEQTICKDDGGRLFANIDNSSIVYDYNKDRMYVPVSVSDKWSGTSKVVEGTLGIVKMDGITLNSTNGVASIANMATYDPDAHTFDFIDDYHIPTTKAVQEMISKIPTYSVEVSKGSDSTPLGAKLYTNPSTGAYVTGTLPASYDTMGKLYLVRSKDIDDTYGQYITREFTSGTATIYEWIYLGSTSLPTSEFVRSDLTIAGHDLKSDITSYDLENSLFQNQNFNNPIKVADRGTYRELTVNLDNGVFMVDEDGQISMRLGVKKYENGITYDMDSKSVGHTNNIAPNAVPRISAITYDKNGHIAGSLPTTFKDGITYDTENQEVFLTDAKSGVSSSFTQTDDNLFFDNREFNFDTKGRLESITASDTQVRVDKMPADLGTTENVYYNRDTNRLVVKYDQHNVYTGYTDPSSSLGKVGDVYIQIEP